jgi:hypothetical protein
MEEKSCISVLGFNSIGISARIDLMVFFNKIELIEQYRDQLSGGVYLYRLTAGNYVKVMKMMLVR